MKFQSFAEEPSDVFDYDGWLILQRGEWREIMVEAWRAQGPGFVLKFTECDTPEAARAYTNAEIGVSREALPALKPGQYYLTDLIGFKVINEQGVDFGVADHFIETGANEILVIKGERERLVPFRMGDVIKKVDMTHKTMVVDWDPEF